MDRLDSVGSSSSPSGSSSGSPREFEVPVKFLGINADRSELAKSIGSPKPDRTPNKRVDEIVQSLEMGLNKFKHVAEAFLSKDPKHLSQSLLKYIQKNKEVLKKDNRLIERISAHLYREDENSEQNSKRHCSRDPSNHALDQFEEWIQCYQDKTDAEILFHAWGDQGKADRGQFFNYANLVGMLSDLSSSMISLNLPMFPDVDDDRAYLAGFLSRSIGHLSILNGTLALIRKGQKKNLSSLREKIKALLIVLNQIETYISRDINFAEQMIYKKSIKGDSQTFIHDLQQIVEVLKELEESCEKAIIRSSLDRKKSSKDRIDED